MKKIYSTKQRKMVEVRSLKNFTCRRHPELKLFVHKTLGAEGYSVSEESIGASVVQRRGSVKEAVKDALEILNSVTKKELKRTLDDAQERKSLPSHSVIN